MIICSYTDSAWPHRATVNKYYKQLCTTKSTAVTDGAELTHNPHKIDARSTLKEKKKKQLLLIYSTSHNEAQQ